MITIETPVADVLAIQLSGTVEESDIEVMEGAFQGKLDTDARFGLVVDMTDWTDITGDALNEDVKFEIGLLRKLSHCPRIALISDKKFLQVVAKFVDPLIPGVEIRNFNSTERDQAIAFASEFAEVKTPEHGVTVIDTGNPHLLGFQVEGRLSKDDIATMVGPLQRAYESEHKVDLLVRWKGYRGFDASVLTDKSVISMKLSSLRHVRRYAVIGAPDWMANVAETIASALPIDVRVFDSDDEDEAWAWLKS